MRKFWIGAGVVAALTLVGCGGGGEEKKAEAPKADSAAAPAGGAGTPDEANGGTITGKVNFEGTKPTMKNLDMSATPFCTRAHAGGAPSEEVVINGNGTVKNAFVWVKSGLPDKQWTTATAPIELDQQGCMYKPHMVVLQVGQPLKIKNNDETLHNIHPRPAVNAEFNIGQPRKGMESTKTFDKKEVMIPVGCDVHPWMRSYISVLDNPFYAVTDEDGKFEIKGLPAGEYEIEAVHEKLKSQTGKITVKDGEKATLDLSYKG